MKGWGQWPLKSFPASSCSENDYICHNIQFASQQSQDITHAAYYRCLSFDFLEFFSLIWGDITGLSHNDIVSCPFISGDSTLFCYRLSANNQDYIFCLLWLFCGFQGKMQMLFNYSKGILINPLGRVLSTTCHGEASFIEQKV